jgi:hypothetical protein
MSSSDNTIPVDLERVLLLQELKQGTLTRERAVRLRRMLEMERQRALDTGNTSLANRLALFLAGLDGYIHGNFELREAIPVRFSNLT